MKQLDDVKTLDLFADAKPGRGRQKKEGASLSRPCAAPWYAPGVISEPPMADGRTDLKISVKV